MKKKVEYYRVLTHPVSSTEMNSVRGVNSLCYIWVTNGSKLFISSRLMDYVEVHVYDESNDSGSDAS